MTRQIRIFLSLFVLLYLFAAFAFAETRGEISFRITLDAPEESKDVRVWLPYPASDEGQLIEDVRFDGNYTSSGIYRDKDTGNLALYAEWAKPFKDRHINLAFRATASERVKKDFPKVESEVPVEVKEYLKGSKFIVTDGKVREVALKATEGKKGILEKARAVYDWVVENTYRDPNVKGCGIGDVEKTLAERGGKCADISSVFVALARAAGVPAREIFGLRLGKKDDEDMTSGHHCWAEFYLPGYGWVPVDPADVRKAMLAKNVELKDAKEIRDYYFGAVDEYRIAFGKGGRGITLSPPQKGGPLNYFMYPYAEIDGKEVDWLAGQKELKYQIRFKKYEK